jgi:hypothetical protein
MLMVQQPARTSGSICCHPGARHLAGVRGPAAKVMNGPDLPPIANLGHLSLAFQAFYSRSPQKEGS